MTEIAYEDEVKNNPWLLRKEYKACQRLWAMVIIFALRDANERIGSAKAKNLEWAVKREMDYFKSRDFKIICERAGVEIELSVIEDGLRRLRKW